MWKFSIKTYKIKSFINDLWTDIQVHNTFETISHRNTFETISHDSIIRVKKGSISHIRSLPSVIILPFLSSNTPSRLHPWCNLTNPLLITTDFISLPLHLSLSTPTSTPVSGILLRAKIGFTVHFSVVSETHPFSTKIKLFKWD